MRKDMEVNEYNYKYTMNRELSWLNFNLRVLEEADRKSVPLLECLKFVSIFCSNLDEFFMVRVGSLFGLSMVSPYEIDNKSGMDPDEQLKEIYKTIPGLIRRKREICQSVQEELRSHGIMDLTYEELTDVEKEAIDEYFDNFVYPVISPQVIGSCHPISHFVNKVLYVTALLGTESKTVLGFIPVPDALPEFLMLSDKTGRYIRMENIILQYTSGLFGKYPVRECCTISITRNADIQFDSDKFEDEATDFRNKVSELLKKRRSQDIVRMEIDRRVSQEFFLKLLNRINVRNKQVYMDESPLNMHYVFGLIEKLPQHLVEELSYEPYVPRWSESLNRRESILSQVEQNDKLFFYPFDSVDPFLRALDEAAEKMPANFFTGC